MSIELWLAFIVASSIMLVIPGPTILTVVSYSAKYGRKTTPTLVTAVCLGDLSVILLSLLGLGGLLAISSNAFNLIKLIGGIYLLILGLKMLRSSLKESSQNVVKVEKSKLFLNTYLITALNPKGIIFFGAFLPQFINEQYAIAPQLALLTITFIVLAAINTLCYALLASRATNSLKSNEAQKKINICGGLVLSGAGIYALGSRN